MALRLECGHSKIGELDVVPTVQQDVLWFQVTMADIEAVAVSQTSDDLTE